jgi:hypothetical protein
MKSTIAMKVLCLMLLLLPAGLTAGADEYTHGWIRQLGGAGSDSGRSVAVDKDGNVYTTGGFMETADFDPGEDTYPLTAAGATDVFLSKLDADGNLVWARRWGGSSHDFGSAVAVDQAGNVYTTGFFEETADFDPGDETYLMTADYVDVFVSKLDSLGRFVWAKRLGGSIIEYGYYLTTDADTNVYITGRFRGTADFDPGPGVYELTATDDDDAFICKLDVNGDFVWARKLGSEGAAYGYAFSIDDNKNVYTIGHFTETADFDPGGDNYFLTSGGEHDVFISKLDSLGRFVWAKQFKGSGHGYGFASGIDQYGHVYVAGHFEGTFDFDPGEEEFLLTAAGEEDIFICKLDSMGNFVWAIQQGGPKTDRCFSLVIDAEGHLYTTGNFSATADFSPGTDGHLLTASGEVDAFVCKIDDTGKTLWTRQISATNVIRSFSLALDSHGSLHAAGFFNDTVYVDTGQEPAQLISKGSNDVFVYKIEKAFTAPATYTIAAVAGEGGRILPEGTTEVEEGEDLVITVVPDDGYRIAYVKVDGHAIEFSSDENWDAENNQYTFRHITSPRTIEAGFEVDDTHAGEISQPAFRLFPNPASHAVRIVSNGQPEGDVAVSLVDMHGRILFHTIVNESTAHEVQISLEKIPAGVYLVRLSGSHINHVQKLLVE